MIGIPLSVNSVDIEKPLEHNLLRNAYANPMDPRSARALKLLLEGLTIREVLAPGVINYHPVVAGTQYKLLTFLKNGF